MGIKNLITKTADKAGNAVAKVSQLSSQQVEDIERKRAEILAEIPDPSDPASEELTLRLLGACGVEIHNAYLPQIKRVYAPVEASAEYGEPFDPSHNIRYLNITKWIVDPKEDSLEKLDSVYDALSDDVCNIALIFDRRKTATNVYLAVVNATNSDNNVDVENLRKRLSDAIRGNFPGSETSDGEAGAPPCLIRGGRFSVATVSNIPTEKSEDFVSQTIEKVLDGAVPRSSAEEYMIILLATPVQDVEERKLRLAELHSALAPYAGWQTNFTYMDSEAIGSSATIGVNAGVSAGTQNGTNSSISESQGDAESEQDSVQQGEQSGESETEGGSESTSKGQTTSETEGHNESTSGGIKLKIFNASHTEGSSTASTVADTLTDTITKNASSTVSKSVSNTIGKTLGRTVSNTIGKTAGIAQSTSLGANFGANFARMSNVTASIGKNEGITQTFSNFTIKHALELLETQMKRLDLASALGMWDFAAYVLCEDHNMASNVAHAYLALTQGEESFTSQAAVNMWRGDSSDEAERDQASNICEYLRDLRHPLFGLTQGLLDARSDFALYPTVVNATTILSGKELAYSLNFPRKSISGLPVIECASFGRNVTKFVDSEVGGNEIEIGKIFHMHKVEPVPVSLSTKSLASHTFVTGSTGAGKTNTVCCMLDQLHRQGVNFLVIEPAKGEYKDIYGHAGGVSVYCTNPAVAPLLKANPFSFPPEIHVLEHLDRLTEIFNACWPMYAAMPAVLKSAISRSYADCGWDLEESANPYGDGLFPSFADVARNIKTILDESEYDAENKGAYKGSLLTRIESLTNGLNGMILCSDEIPSESLFDESCVVDLSRVGSAETKSLLMGVLVLKLQEYRMANSDGLNIPLRHVTVLEEAHNLLKRVSTEQSGESANLAGKSVEMISNAIAEMRAFGEGFIIADQAPGLLDMAAIRNTNTKVVMRLPDMSDRELVGRAANLNDEQIVELARLPLGVAAVYQNDWVEPVLCKVGRAGEGSRWTYERPASQGRPSKESSAVLIADLLAECAHVSDPSLLREVHSAMEDLALPASMRVSILKMLENPPLEPMMTKIAPVVAASFRDVTRAVKEAHERSKETTDWTAAAEAALQATLTSQISKQTERVIIQGVLTDYLLNELKSEQAFKDWYDRWG